MPTMFIKMNIAYVETLPRGMKIATRLLNQRAESDKPTPFGEHVSTQWIKD